MSNVHLLLKTLGSFNCFRDYQEDIRCMVREGRRNLIMLSRIFSEIVNAVS